MSLQNLPRLIGLCGHPGSGKSEVQKILHSHFQYIPVDDGGPLRNIGIEYLGLTTEQVYTQWGKAEYVEILGKRWQVRDILGTLGKQLEDMFGEHIMPFMVQSQLEPGKRYSFGSVRKTQGHFYKEQGGMIIGIRRPGVEPSPYEFDKFDESVIDVWIENDGPLSDLGWKIYHALLNHAQKMVA